MYVLHSFWKKQRVPHLPRVEQQDVVHTQHCELTLLIFQQCIHSQKLQLVSHWVYFPEYNGTCVPPLNETVQIECNPGGHYGRLPTGIWKSILSDD